MPRHAIRADLLDFSADPGWAAGDGAPGVRFRGDHWLLIDGERIAGVQADAPDDSWQRHDHAGQLLMPGFIDTHVHMPQLEVIGSYGAELLDWLNRYTFAAEARYADPAVCAQNAARFLDALLAHGTTAAMVFPTVHAASADALFAAAAERGMRIITGQCLMDRHAPPALTVACEQAERDSEDLIARWHGQGRNAYAATVRFAPTSTDAQLAMAGALLARHPGLYLQTHVAENRAELAWVAELFPNARSYLDVYARHGLIGARSMLAHGIWLDDADRALLAREHAAVAHCPSSNLFLGSGLMPWRKLGDAGVAVTLGSDVGGGTSLSMQRTMAEAYKVQALQQQALPAWKALYSATRGAAMCLGLEHEIGSLDVGCMADVCLWQWAVGSVAQTRDACVNSVHERVFAWMTLADERNLVASLVAGNCSFPLQGGRSRESAKQSFAPAERLGHAGPSLRLGWG
jgi:guanine deaminase